MKRMNVWIFMCGILLARVSGHATARKVEGADEYVHEYWAVDRNVLHGYHKATELGCEVAPT